MLLKVQNEYKSNIEQCLFEKGAGSSFFKFVSQQESSADLIIGSAEYLEQHGAHFFHKIIIMSEHNLSTDIIHKISKNSHLHAVNEAQLEKTSDILHSILQQINKKQQITQVKSDIQKKRIELELLNQKLSLESEKRIQTLEQSHIEETEKNQTEKSLLHFLDFIQSESTGDDFLEKIFRFFWKDLKKISRTHLVGISVATSSDKSKIVFFDGTNEFTAVSHVQFGTNQTATQLASHWGRPVGQIISWLMPEMSRESYFFIETVGLHAGDKKIQNYFNERIAVLSMYLDRWFIEKEIEMVVERWKNTFESFSGYTHVIDENFKIYQSNYKLNSKSNFCYEVLANRATPCEHCPVVKNKNTQFVLKNDLSVKTYFSQFKYQQKKYFFVIYEDVTKLHLLQSHIIQTEKMSTLGRLGNHLAHELNNPLTGIKSYVQTLMQDEPMMSTLPTTAKSDLNEIFKATVRCQKIIKNFIDFSHKKEPKLEQIQFAEVLQNTIVLLKTALRSHRLFIDLKDDLVLVNAHDLQQVIFNLIKNSCQAMSQIGSIKIYQESHASKNIFIIEDTGVGFSAEILNNIFQAFMTTKQQGEGTGLGLYLSKKLMNNMNADLQVTSTLGQGAKISLIFDKL